MAILQPTQDKLRNDGEDYDGATWTNSQAFSPLNRSLTG